MPQPVVLHPVFIAKPWAGDYLNKITPGGNNIFGEMILASGLDTFNVQCTLFEDKTPEPVSFSTYWQQQGLDHALTCGYSKPGDDFPLLLKILSVKSAMSLQVHPADSDIKNLPDIEGYGKHEAWALLDTEENSRFYLGLKNYNNLDQQLKELSVADEKKALSLFNCYSFKPGQIIDLKPGLIHGTSGHILFFEIQQPSDHTFRIYDFGRKRPLHREHAFKVIKEQTVETSTFEQGLGTGHFNLQIQKAEAGHVHKIEKPFQLVTYFGRPAKIQCGNAVTGVTWGTTILFFKGSDFTLALETSSGDEALPFTKENEALLFFSSP